MKTDNILRLISVLILSAYCATVLSSSSDSNLRAPGWGELPYTPPAAGTYALPAILPAVDGEVIRSNNSVARLFDLMSDRIVLLSFIFSRCSDVNGCPLSNAVLYKVQSRLNQQPEFTDKVALLSVSFDPEFDTPEITSALEKSFNKGDVEWEFLTTRDERALKPILDGYGQYAFRTRDENGHPVGDYAHILRVYLIDRDRQVRNIYSVSFLHPDILMNDVETLLLETSAD